MGEARERNFDRLTAAGWLRSAKSIDGAQNWVRSAKIDPPAAAPNSLLSGKLTGIFLEIDGTGYPRILDLSVFSRIWSQIP